MHPYISTCSAGGAHIQVNHSQPAGNNMTVIIISVSWAAHSIFPAAVQQSLVMPLHCVAGWNSYHISELLTSHAPLTPTWHSFLAHKGSVFMATSGMAVKAPFTKSLYMHDNLFSTWQTEHIFQQTEQYNAVTHRQPTTSHSHHQTHLYCSHLKSAYPSYLSSRDICRLTVEVATQCHRPAAMQ